MVSIEKYVARNDFEREVLDQVRKGVFKPAPEPTKISIKEYLLLTGLLAVAAKHVDALNEIEQEVSKICAGKSKITQAIRDNVSDWVWGGATRADGLLERLNIKVAHCDETFMIF